jgi:hypothetical protein
MNTTLHLQARPAAPIQSWYAPPPPLDADDELVLREIHESQLWILDRSQHARGDDGRFGRGVGAFFGTHEAEKTRVYRVQSPDGYAWSYVQPYSIARQMPGEHHFVLRGALPQAITVEPPSNTWKRPSTWMRLTILSVALLLFFGLGVLVPIIFLAVHPYRAKFVSTNPLLAKWIRAQAPLVMQVRATSFGWTGLLGTGGWKLPWCIQLHSLGNGTSRLVVKAPDAGRWSITRNRAGFAQAVALARVFQLILRTDHAVPAQPPMHPTMMG